MHLSTELSSKKIKSLLSIGTVCDSFSVSSKPLPERRGHPGLPAPLQRASASAGCSRQAGRQELAESMLLRWGTSRKHLSPCLSIDFVSSFLSELSLPKPTRAGNTSGYLSAHPTELAHGSRDPAPTWRAQPRDAGGQSSPCSCSRLDAPAGFPTLYIRVEATGAQSLTCAGTRTSSGADERLPGVRGNASARRGTVLSASDFLGVSRFQEDPLSSPPQAPVFRLATVLSGSAAGQGVAASVSPSIRWKNSSLPTFLFSL